MIKAVKVRLLPTEEQEISMFKSVGTARFAYNWGLARWQELYKNGVTTNGYSLKKEFNNTIKKQEDYKWLYDVSAEVTSQTFKDLNQAFNNFFKKKCRYPIFKSIKKSRKSFYVRYDRMCIKDSTVNIEKVGRMKFKTNLEIPKLGKYMNPRCNYDGKYWYLTFGFEQDENQIELNQDLSIGIDLGISTLAVVNHLEEPIKNINKSQAVRRLKKKLRRLQRQVSRKYEMNKEGSEFIKTSNIKKLENKIKLIYRTLTNIRQNHIHHATKKIVDMKPYRVVMENLNVMGMLKNRHLSKTISEQKFYEFTMQMKHKCKRSGIEFIRADRFFPSSKMCSNCGNVKKELKLSTRTYRCECGFVMDRDKNASINLGNYKLV